MSEKGILEPEGNVKKVLAELDRLFPNAACSLRHSNPLELTVATILSAQCTDERVNIVTRDLFKKYRTPADYAHAPAEELEDDIRSTGFFRNKAKSIKGLGRALLEKHNGTIPNTLDELVKLPGVGRKTANVVLGNAFGVPGVTVDTHVGRISRRLGLTENTDPVKIEFDLMEKLPREKWTKISHQLILFGRSICSARKPKCRECPIIDICVFEEKNL